jgi:hypothetical protein
MMIGADAGHGTVGDAAREQTQLVDLEGWRRGLEPPTTGTTTRGSTN